MKCPFIQVLLLTCAISTLLIAEFADAKVLHRERSLYQTILITKERGRLCLQFSIRREQRNQSCMNPDRPRELLFPYTRMMMAALLLNPEPRNILVVGLGGGTLPTALSELYPEAEQTVVEIDAAVVKAARQFFDYEPGERTRVVVQDARVFTKRQARRVAEGAPGYDLVMLDAFNGDYIPEHLLTQEYLEETRSIMAEDGILAANTFAISKLYDHESTTYAAVFGQFLNYRLAQTGNRVILARNTDNPAPLATVGSLRSAAQALDPLLKPYRIRLLPDVRDMLTGVDWDTGARILTDQYSPANVLSSRPRN